MTRNGFTLVELLVALLIFGLLSAAGVALLRFGVDSRGRAGERFDAVAALTRTRALLETDLAQAAPRPPRDAEGRTLPAFIVEPGRLGLVRRGWRNDDGAARASVQRVEYRVRDGRLERIAWTRLDGTPPSEPVALMSGVRSVRLRARHKGEWRDVWDPQDPRRLPDAVELTLDFDRAPELRMAFLVGPGA